MSNIIDSIQLSGSSYDLKDKNAPSVSAVTQQEYDNLPSSAKTSNTFFVITDAQAGDLTNYYTKSETNTLLDEKADTATTYTKTETDNAITAATSTKQDTLVSSQNIKTINNESILGEGNIDIQGGGGGKAVSGGTNISITTGETADTINCTLPISRGSGNNNSLILGTGNRNTASGEYSIAVGGKNNSSSKYCSLVGGNENNVSNEFETVFGNSNISNHASNTFGDSGNTLFSVANGTNYLLRHNAFEIRQDGSIYIPDLSNGTSYRDRPMIKLQDALGGGGSSYTAGDGIDITNDVISVSGVSHNSLADGTKMLLRGDFTSSNQNYTNIGFDYYYGTSSNKNSINIKPLTINGKSALRTAALSISVVETSAITTAITSSSTDAQVPSAKAVNDKLGGLSLVKLTQAEYDALATKDNSTLYIIVN